MRNLEISTTSVTMNGTRYRLPLRCSISMLTHAVLAYKCHVTIVSDARSCTAIQCQPRWRSISHFFINCGRSLSRPQILQADICKAISCAGSSMGYCMSSSTFQSSILTNSSCDQGRGCSPDEVPRHDPRPEDKSQRNFARSSSHRLGKYNPSSNTVSIANNTRV